MVVCGFPGTTRRPKARSRPPTPSGSTSSRSRSSRMPEHDTRPEAAYRLIHDELLLDGSSRLNLATFVTTWMEPEADRLMTEAFDKNMIDKDEYPQTAEIERRCVNMVARLFHAPDEGDASAPRRSARARPYARAGSR